ncbi:MAG TPA: DUF2779 domain-containing protein, partial [Fimbriimonadaceae bacterium]|nr:DUF2779 domain-containing protein [Fimbriimonadaceae bacterium]
FKGIRPYEQVCFQWSAHIMDSPDAEPRHLEFLGNCDADPREEFCRTLLEAVKGCETFLFYTPFEKVRLREMRDAGIECAAELHAIAEVRGLDLEKLVRENVYLESFKGRTSIKEVLPALVPASNWEGLNIKGGEAAALAYKHSVLGRYSKEEAEAVRQDMLAYCKQDTLAMVEVYWALRRLVAGA